MAFIDYIPFEKASESLQKLYRKFGGRDHTPADIKEMVKNAKKYPEGRAIKFDVTNKKQVELIKKLIRIRMES